MAKKRKHKPTEKQLAEFEEKREAFIKANIIDNPFAKEANAFIEEIKQETKKNVLSSPYKPTASSLIYRIPTKDAETPKNAVVLNYSKSDSTLSRTIDGETFSYDFNEDGKRKKLLNILLKQRTYVKRVDLKNELGCPSPEAVSKIAQTFNSYANNSLHLKKAKVIEGKKGSGYRINPKLIIQKQ